MTTEEHTERQSKTSDRRGVVVGCGLLLLVELSIAGGWFWALRMHLNQYQSGVRPSLFAHLLLRFGGPLALLAVCAFALWAFMRRRRADVGEHPESF